MAGVVTAAAAAVTHSQPRTIAAPAANLSVQPPTSSTSSSTRKPLTIETFSPVTQNGSYEFDRIIKSGELLKRTRKTKAWKPVFIVLRPNLLSIYRNRDESKLRHSLRLSELTAVARHKDPKGRARHIFALYSPARNFHLEAHSDRDAQQWVEDIRREARIDEDDDEVYLGSPAGHQRSHSELYQGFGQSMDDAAPLSPGGETDSHAFPDDQGGGGGYSSSDADVLKSPTIPQHPPHSRHRDRGLSSLSANSAAITPRQPSHVEYSGAEHGSYSDFSDTATARVSALSLSLPWSDASMNAIASPNHPPQAHSIYGALPSMAHTNNPTTGPTTVRPGLAPRSASQQSGLALAASQNPGSNNANIQKAIILNPSKPSAAPLPPHEDDERVLHHSWILLLNRHRGVRHWKKMWMVLRPKALALYSNEDEYRAKLILPLASILDVVEIDPVSRTKTACMQVLGEERNYRFCAMDSDEEALARWLGALKSLLSKRRVGHKDGERGVGSGIGMQQQQRQQQQGGVTTGPGIAMPGSMTTSGRLIAQVAPAG